jgi:hypothetical protein
MVRIERHKMTDAEKLTRETRRILTLELAETIGAVAQQFEDEVPLNTLIAYPPSFGRRPAGTTPDTEHAPIGWNELMDSLETRQRIQVEALINHVLRGEHHRINYMEHKMETLGDMRLFLVEGNTNDHRFLGPLGVAFGRIAFGSVRTSVAPQLSTT